MTCTEICESETDCDPLGGVCALSSESDALTSTCLQGQPSAGLCLAPCETDLDCALTDVCLDNACAPADVECPGGLRYFCGASIGRAARTLYECTAGEFTEAEQCSGGCVSQTDRNDVCLGGCPAGPGNVCGSEIGLDPNALYACEGDAVTLVRYCNFGCFERDGGAWVCEGE